MIDLIHQEALKQFREELFAEGILHEGDTIGTSDETLLCVKICSLEPPAESYVYQAVSSSA